MTVQAETMDLKPVDAVLERYGCDKSWLVMILQDAQEAYNWLPRPVMERVAERLGVPLSQVYNVATFYASFSLTQRGKHLVRVCDGTACHLKGSTWLVKELERMLKVKEGGTTNDGLFTFETVACLGACALAPVMTVDTTYYGQMNPEKARETLDRYRRQAGS